MPEITQVELEKRIKDLTARVGRLKRELTALDAAEGTTTADIEAKSAEIRNARKTRETIATELGKRFDSWMLVNPAGRTEFVTRDEWANRMAVWSIGRDIEVFRAMGVAPNEQAEREALNRARAAALRHCAVVRGEAVASEPIAPEPESETPEPFEPPMSSGPDGDGV